MGLADDEWFPSRLLFGKFKGRIYQEAAEDGELKSWIEWLAESTTERSSAMGRWYLAQLAGGASLEDVALIDLQVSQGENRAAAGLVVFQHPEAGLYQQLITGKSWCGCFTRISTSTTRKRTGTSNGLEEE